MTTAREQIAEILERAEKAGNAFQAIVEAHFRKKPIPLRMSIPVRQDLNNDPDTDVLIHTVLGCDIPELARIASEALERADRLSRTVQRLRAELEARRPDGDLV